MKNPIIRIIASFVVAVFACGANGAGLPKDSVAKLLSDKNDAWPVAYRYRVSFTDKSNNSYSTKRPEEFLPRRPWSVAVNSASRSTNTTCP